MMRIVPLSEGAFTVDRSKDFVPFDIEKDDLQERTKGSLLVEIQPFLLITDDEKILLDTGLGFTNSEGEMQIHELLKKNGVHPEEITKVLMSHLHKDHSGGMLLPDKQTPAFANAAYYINRQEWELALQGSSSYRPADFSKLKDIHFTDGDGMISEGIEYIFTGAHSPYHQAFKFSGSGNTVFFGGDVAPQLQQMRHRFKAKYDYQPEEAMTLRQEWKERGIREEWTFLFYHDIKYPSYQFRMD